MTPGAGCDAGHAGHAAQRGVGTASATVHAILDRRRTDPLAVASIDDFWLDAGEAADAERMLSDPACVPYCLDAEGSAVVLAELPPGESEAVAKSAFHYAGLYRQARRVVRVPLDAFLAFCRTMPDPERLLLIHTTGRSGSTLLTSALGERPDVRTLSEPDVFTQGAMAGPATDERLRATLAAVYRGCLRLLCRAPARLHVVKLRSIAIEHADLIGAGMSGVHRVFLYRDPVAVSRSTARILGRDPAEWVLDARDQRAWRALAPLLPSASQASGLDAYILYAALWAGPVRAYLRGSARAPSPWLGSLRYEDLCADPAGAIAALLSRCAPDIPPPTATPLAFARDAQRDSALDRARLAAVTPGALQARLAAPEFAERVLGALARVAPELSPDEVLPGRVSSGDVSPDRVLPNAMPAGSAPSAARVPDSRVPVSAMSRSAKPGASVCAPALHAAAATAKGAE